MNPRDFVLPATDTYPLAARLWSNSQVPLPNAVAVINAGAGIRTRYYDRFARFLAGTGVPTLFTTTGASANHVLDRYEVSEHPSKIGEARIVPRPSIGSLRRTQEPSAWSSVTASGVL